MPTDPAAPSETGVTTRSKSATISRLHRRIRTLGDEIKAIRDKGVLALENSAHRVVFRGMMATLESTYKDFLDGWDQCYDFCEVNEIQFPSTEDKSYLSAIKEMYYEANGTHAQLEDSRSVPRASDRFSLNQTSLQFPQPPRTILPKINIRPFSGKFSEWVNFKQLFTSLIINDDSLTHIQRFHFLMSYLEGPALDTIKSIEVVDSNFTQAWEALCRVYDNKRKMACAYLEKLLLFKPHTGKPSAESLQHYLSDVSESIISLKNLHIPELAEYILCELALRSLDVTTRQAFEISIIGTDFPKFTVLQEFVQSRFQVLRLTQEPSAFESASRFGISDRAKVFKPNKLSPKPTHGQALLAHSSNPKPETAVKVNCYICNQPHIIKECPKFRSFTPSQRLDALRQFPGCRNCLFPFHKTSQCTSKYSCKFCKQRHHKDLHLGSSDTPQVLTSKSPNDRSPQSTSSFCGANISSFNGVLLGTIRARILDSAGQPREFRGILDQGSQYSFIVESAARALGKPAKPFHGNITGVGSSPLREISGKINITFQSEVSNFDTEAIVVRTITPPLPQTNLSSDMWFEYKTYDLSDKEFNLSKPISFLIGADLYPDIVRGAPIVLHENGPRLLWTVFGFSVMGRYICTSDKSDNSSISCLTYLSTTEFPIEKFWEVEEPLLVPTISKEDQECEEHFVKTHYRVDGGRYGVRLPFKSGTPKIIPNTKVAFNRFYALESKLAKNDQLRNDYHAFMRQYLDLGHMRIAQTPPSYVIPHHPVYKYDLQGNGKVRVVFDGGFVTSTGSLNQWLHPGPKLQSDIASVVLNFRRFAYVVTCDIVKCFRQILVHPEDRKFQQIIWRFNPKDAVAFYELNTVTYGLRSSPYQSQRVVMQLLEDEGEAYPLANRALRDSIYIDDCPCGADSPEELFELKMQLISLLAKGGFELGKWNSNYPPLLSNHSTSINPISIWDEEEDRTTKILGMVWDPKSDTFRYEFSLPDKQDFSKRTILSVIARLFDPLGYVAPIIFYAKTILQETWKSGVNWDVEVPKHIQRMWLEFMNDLHNISQISIPRHLPKSDTVYRLLGFSDASEKGYCGVLYLHGTQGSHTSMTLIKAKTRLAPLKTLTIPRLELQGAVLLSQLIKSVEPLTKHLGISSYFCFTDSRILLAWLKTPTYQLKTFVANRTQQVLDVTPANCWYHISGTDNPSADLGSRGALVTELLAQDFWWSGPPWCREPFETWPLRTESTVVEVPEMKPPQPAVTLTTIQETNDIIIYMERHSSFLRLIRVMGYVRRFIFNARTPSRRRRRRRRTGPLTSIEVRESHNSCVRIIQQHHFPEAFLSSSKENLSKELRRLAIFIDHETIIRVGGRLANAPLSVDHRHPVLLPARSHFTNLVVDYLHRKNNHPGPAALVAFIRHQYWIPRVRSLVRLHKMKCVVCTRYSSSASPPFMGDLPTARVSGVRAFLNCGVDMAGPFICRDTERRNSKTHKAYLCLFICLASRAVHLELCGSLSVESFIDAFDRFSARRGIPAHMYSDCGGNFVGTSRYLNEIQEWVNKESTQSSIVDRTSHSNVEWSFNPPASPHFGGSWESGIKSAKALLHKTIGAHCFTENELNTIFIKIEGILNSRPLLPLSTSPEDPEVLTPGHFTIGQPTNALPEPDFADISPNRLSRWQLIRERVQHFWSRWRDEYLTSLQVRAKWNKKIPNLHIGDVVLVKNDQTFPTHWPLARISKVHPGADDIVRVVTLKTSKGIFKRSVANLIPLPVNEHPESRL